MNDDAVYSASGQYYASLDRLSNVHGVNSYKVMPYTGRCVIAVVTQTGRIIGLSGNSGTNRFTRLPEIDKVDIATIVNKLLNLGLIVGGEVGIIE